MMVQHVFKAMVLSLAFAVLVFFGVGLILADRWQIETVRSFPVPPPRLEALLRDFGTWQDWSAYAMNLGSPTERKVSGEPGTEGHRVVWSGPRGQATLLFTAVRAGAIEYQLLFQPAGAATATEGGGGAVHWQEDGAGTRVTWRDGGTFESLPKRWFGWFGALQERVRETQRASLGGLAQQLEQAPAAGR